MISDMMEPEEKGKWQTSFPDLSDVHTISRAARTSVPLHMNTERIIHHITSFGHLVHKTLEKLLNVSFHIPNV